MIQGPSVAGEVSLTCDAWQASNTDGYFAVTGHWIDESVPTQWELKSALLGFTRLCNSHSGERLGQALFKIVERVSITQKVLIISLCSFQFALTGTSQIGHVTCDNASNNSTMMQEFATRLTTANDKVYNARQRKIKCVISSVILFFLLIDAILVVLRTLLTWPLNALSQRTVTPPTLIRRIPKHMSR